jgi:DNA-binding IclR family transcriptional regulator
MRDNGLHVENNFSRLKIMASVPSAERTLNLFEAFGTVGKPLGLSELAQRMNVPVSSCHGLVQTLLARGYLYALGRRRDFYPTRRLFDLAQTIVRNDPFLERLGAELQALRDETRETVIVGKRQGDAVLYLDVVEGPHTVRYTAGPGEYKPLHSSSIGKVMLGAMANEALEEWLRSHSLPAVTGHTLVDPARLRCDLEESRRRGWFMTRGENVEDVTALAVALSIRDEVFGLAVAGPSHRMAKRVDELAARLVAAGRRIEELFRQ